MSSPSLQEGKLLKRVPLYLGLLACKGLKTTFGAMSNLGKKWRQAPRVMFEACECLFAPEISETGIANSLMANILIDGHGWKRDNQSKA